MATAMNNKQNNHKRINANVWGHSQAKTAKGNEREKCKGCVRPPTPPMNKAVENGEGMNKYTMKNNREGENGIMKAVSRV